MRNAPKVNCLIEVLQSKMCMCIKNECKNRCVGSKVDCSMYWLYMYSTKTCSKIVLPQYTQHVEP